jgi:ribosomal protein S25
MLSLSKVIGTIVVKELLYKTLTEVAKEIIISYYGLDNRYKKISLGFARKLYIQLIKIPFSSR